MSDEFRREARRFEESVIEEVWHRGNLKVVDLLFDPDYVSHQSGAPPSGQRRPPAEIKRGVVQAREAFPDFRLEIGHFMAAGGEGSAEISYHYTFTGTHRGYLHGLAPTGRRVGASGMCMYRMTGGRYVEGWELLDGVHLARQLGLAPGPGAHARSRPTHVRNSAAPAGGSSWRQRNGWSDLSLLAAFGLGWMIGDE